jgi:hypothetical protein
MEQVTEQVTEAAPDYDSMSVEQLRQEAFPNETPAPVEQKQATEEPKAEAEQVVQQQLEAKPELKAVDEIPAWFKTYETNMKRELGSYRGVMSEVQKLKQMLEASQQQQQLNPEDQQVQAEQAALQKRIQEIAIQGVMEKFGPQAELLQRLEQQEQDTKYMGDVFSLVSDKVPNAKEAWDSIWKENAEKIEAGDESAIAWQDRALKEPAFLALEILNRKSEEISTKNNAFIQGRKDAGAKAAQVVKQGAVQVQAKKALNEMSQEELDAMPTDELRKRTEAEGHFRG